MWRLPLPHASVTEMRIDLLLRNARRAAGLSQREVADRAGVARSVIGRIESGATADPALHVVRRILEATGCTMLLLDRNGRELTTEHAAHEHAAKEPRDRAGRRYPAHLRLHEVEPWDYWWGWGRIAWSMRDTAVPTVTFVRRRRSSWDDPYYADRRWDDAT